MQLQNYVLFRQMIQKAKERFITIEIPSYFANHKTDQAYQEGYKLGYMQAIEDHKDATA